MTPRATLPLLRLGLALSVGVTAASCSSSGRAAGTSRATSATAPATVAPSTAAPSTAAPTTSTTPVPPAPQPSPDQAAAHMVSAWAAGDRAAASAVATRSAVDQLFAAPYPGAGLAIPRGCSAAFPPIVCTYGPPGGGSAAASIYELYVSQSPTGWYVSSVSVLP
ncbi:MAG TPA: hypothetical protein VLX59_05295 [Acidimicrobiales bacterium]|nr:hypothetical protein [Acidimicrobiales bacterium]